jgi:acetamidase/formamidase
MKTAVPARAALVLAALACATTAFAQSQPSVAGRWSVRLDEHGTPVDLDLQLKQNGTAVTGQFFGLELEGKLTGDTLRLTSRTKDRPASGEARVVGDRLEGQITLDVSYGGGGTPTSLAFTATRVLAADAGAPKRHEFTPSVFHRQFSALIAPVLTIAPGDTIVTTTVDAGGTDEKNQHRSAGGNPQTGPFYVQGAMPGDTLAVHIKRLRLNRDWAISDDAIVPRALGLLEALKSSGKPVRWKLDREKGLAMPDKPGEHTGSYWVPVRPMLGCVATAPPAVDGPAPTRDSGPYGGNMDFNEIVEGATIYLPVSVPGALLYFGDGHALQGDGEINGNALETSLDVEVSVELIPASRIPGPRVENDTHIMGMGLAGSLDDAFRGATANLAAWLEHDYHLTSSEVAEVIGTAVEYRISEVADRNAGVVAKLAKARLATLTKEAANAKKAP